jgi:hypothetical protein
MWKFDKSSNSIEAFPQILGEEGQVYWIWIILLELYFIVVLRYASYHMLEVSWLSAEQFDTLYRMQEQTFLAYLHFSL